MIKPTIKAPDFRKAVVEIGKIGKEKLEEIQNEIIDSADRIVAVAKNTAPVNEGSLRREISRKEITPYEFEIVADTKYAVFMEFGTSGKKGSQVVIPPGAEEIAAEARLAYQKGKRGTLAEMERSIRRWVKLKGLAGTYSVKTRRRTGSRARRQAEDDSVVFLIMRKIINFGVKPQPFFFRSIQGETPRLGKEIARIIKE